MVRTHHAFACVTPAGAAGHAGATANLALEPPSLTFLPHPPC
jgi:hypothetical protein